MSVVVATRRRPDLLRRCVEALLAQDADDGYEIVVVNDDTEPLAPLPDDPRLQVVENGRRGVASARNRGVLETRSPVVAFTDDDTIPTPGWIRSVIAATRNNPDAVAFEGPVEVGRLDPLYEHAPRTRPGLLCAANVAYRRAAFDRLGGFDEWTMGVWSEDRDLAERAKSIGPTRYVPEMLVAHPPRPISFRELVAAGRQRRGGLVPVPTPPVVVALASAPTVGAGGHRGAEVGTDVGPCIGRTRFADPGRAAPCPVRVRDGHRAVRVVAAVAGAAGMTGGTASGSEGGLADPPEGSNPSVDVVVPTYRRPDLLEQCLDTLAAQTLAPGCVVVALRPDDLGSRAVVAASTLPGIVEAKATEPGLLAALRVGVARTRAGVIAITDDDARPRPDWLERIVAAFADPMVGAVGGRINLGLPPRPGALVGDINRVGRLIGNHEIGSGDAREVDVLAGANATFRADTLMLPVSGVLFGDGAEPHYEVLIDAWVRRKGRLVVFDPAIVVDHRPTIDVLPGDDLAHARASRTHGRWRSHTTGSLVSLRWASARGTGSSRTGWVSACGGHPASSGLLWGFCAASGRSSGGCPRPCGDSWRGRVTRGRESPRGRECHRAARSADGRRRTSHRTMTEPLRVLLISRAGLVGTYQRKLEEIANRGVDVVLVVPSHWREPGRVQHLEQAHVQGYGSRSSR